MRLIRDSIVCYPNLGREDVNIYVPNMTEKDREYFQNYGDGAYYSYWPNRFNDYFWTSYWLKWWYNRRENKNSMSLLDLGCGNSLWPHYVKEKYPDSYVKGIDTPKYGSVPTRVVSNFDLDINGVENFDFPQDEFDVVTTISAFEHFDVDKKLLVEKMIRTLKLGGLLLITTDFWFKDQDRIFPGSTTFGLDSLSSVFGLTKDDKSFVTTVTQLPQYKKSKLYFLHLGFENE